MTILHRVTADVRKNHGMLSKLIVLALVCLPITSLADGMQQQQFQQQSNQQFQQQVQQQQQDMHDAQYQQQQENEQFQQQQFQGRTIQKPLNRPERTGFWKWFLGP